MSLSALYLLLLLQAVSTTVPPAITAAASNANGIAASPVFGASAFAPEFPALLFPVLSLLSPVLSFPAPLDASLSCS